MNKSNKQLLMKQQYCSPECFNPAGSSDKGDNEKIKHRH